jgi:hypothetical protein
LKPSRRELIFARGGVRDTTAILSLANKKEKLRPGNFIDDLLITRERKVELGVEFSQ